MDLVDELGWIDDEKNEKRIERRPFDDGDLRLSSWNVKSDDID